MNPAVHSAILGIRTVAHLDGIERAAESIPEPEATARLEEIFNINGWICHISVLTSIAIQHNTGGTY